MSSEWSNIPFGNFISFQRGHDLPEQERIKGDVPILGSFGVTGWHNKSIAQAPGLTIGRSGASFGTATYTERDYFPLNTTLYVTDFKGNHPKFAYYFAEQFDFTSFNSGSAQPSLNRNFINPVEVRIPPLAEQKAIAHILGTLDEKIELNRKTNETLEAIAKALFKSWFVEFDPVRAKAEGRPTGLPAEISDLFPDSFEESELGEIPSGWSVEALSDIAQISTGKRPVSVAESRSSANNIPVYGGAGVMGYTCSALTDGEPILTTGRVGTLGVVNRVIEKVWISDNTLIINPGRNNFVYVYLFLLRQDLKSLNRGSTQPLLSQTELKSLPIARPPASVLRVFCELTQHWQERQSTLLKENVNIKALIDTLLPKLISGEIRIPDAEKMLEEVGV